MDVLISALYNVTFIDTNEKEQFKKEIEIHCIPSRVDCDPV
jgi:hypothetical protein